MAELVDGAGSLTEVAEIVGDGSCCWASVEVCLRSPEREAREKSSLVCGSLVLPSQRRVQLGPGELLVAVGLAVEVGEVTGVLRR